ncbi:MAG: hypothetical protein AAF533_11725 [Acidobacteriota bacterium]
MIRRRLVSSLLTITALGAVSLDAAHALEPVRPDAEQLTRSGWQPASEAGHFLAVDRPRMPAADAVTALLGGDPGALSRPGVHEGAERVSLPIAAIPGLLQREGEGAAAIATWHGRMNVVELGKDTLAFELDLPPYRSPLPSYQVSPRFHVRDDGRTVLESVEDPAQRARPTMLRTDPTRRFGGSQLVSTTQLPDTGTVTAELEVTRLKDPLHADGLVVTTDGGASWTRLAIEKEREGTHALMPRHVFSVGRGDSRRLHVFLAPRRELSAAMFFRVSASEGRAVPVASPIPEDAEWTAEPSDLRLDAQGRLEALVMAHDPRTKRLQGQLSVESWGAHLRQVDGKWVELERFPLPGDARLFQLRFDDSKADVFRLEDVDGAFAMRPRKKNAKG